MSPERAQNSPVVFLVVPAFNESASVGAVCARLRGRYANVVVIDDGSSDETATVARKAGAIVLRHTLNRGQGAALQTGIDYALQRGAEVIVTFDSDGQHQVEDVEALLAPVLEGTAVCSPALARAPSQDVLDGLVGERVALIGHEPWTGELVAWLTTGAPSHGSVFAFKRGGIAWLEGQPQPALMVLRAFLPPKVLRELGEGAAH